MKQIMILLILLQPFLFHAQSCKEKMEKYLFSDGSSGNMAFAIYDCPDEALLLLEPYHNYVDERVRANALLLYNICEKDKKKIVRRLAEGLHDKGRYGYVKATAVSLLKGKNRSDFDSVAKQQIIRCLSENNIHNSDYMEVIGLTKIPETIPLLKARIKRKTEEAQRPNALPYDPWLAHLTLARLGDEESTKICAARFDILIDSNYMAPSDYKQLEYMCNAEGVRLMTKMLNQKTFSSDMGGDIMVYPHAAIAYMSLATIIKNLPEELPSKKTLFLGLKKEHIETLRVWLSSHERSMIELDDERTSY
jgi:hypothetical protein